MSDNFLKRMVRAYVGDQAITADFVKDKISAAIGDNAFVNMVAGLGTTRDKASHGKFMPAKRMSVSELDDIYHSDTIAEIIIEKPADDAVSGGWYYSKLNDDQNQEVISFCKNIKLRDILLDALTHSRLHGWCYILVGVDREGDDLTQPIEMGFGELSYFTILKRDEIKPKKDGDCLSADITKGRYKEPEFYQIGNDYNPSYIHHSRIIPVHAPGRIRGKDNMPMPVLQSIHDRLVRHVSATANASSLIYEAKTDIIKIPDLMDKLTTNPTGTLNSLIQRFTSLATMKGNNGMMVIDLNEGYESKAYSFGGLSDLIREFRVETAGAAKMPYALLFGQSQTGLSATGDFDMKSYFGSINSMQENVLRDVVEEIISLVLLSLGINSDDVGLVFEPIWKEDRKTLSEIERSNAERDAVYLERGIITEAHAAQQLVDDGTYTTIDAEHIEMLKGLGGPSYELRT